MTLIRYVVPWLIAWTAAVAWAQTVTGSATVLSLQGLAEYRDGVGGDWRPASVRQKLRAGQFLRTGAHARAALLLTDQTQIRLNERTVIEIVAIAAAPRTAGQTRFRQTAGRGWVQSKRPPTELVWETPVAVAGIRGTDWEMAVDETGRSTLSVFSGAVAFSNELGHVEVAANEQAAAEAGRAPVKRQVQNLKERVQWVATYEMSPWRDFVFESEDTAALHRRLTALTGQDAASQLARGRILADLGRWPEAEQAFQSALAQRGDDPDAALGLAVAALRRNDTKAAARWLESAANAGDAELRRLAEAAGIMIELDLTAAGERLHALTRQPDTRRPTAWLWLADIEDREGRIESGLDILRDGLARFPKQPRLFARQARLLLTADRADEAAALAERTVAAHPDSFEAWLVRADIARREGQAALAFDAYDRAIALKPDDDRPWYGRGIAHAEREYLRDARADLQRALALNPDGPGYRGELGALEVAALDFPAAEAAYADALKADPADFVALTGQGMLALRRGRDQAALTDFLQAGVMAPRYARAHVYAAAAYYRRGETHQAESELARASGLDAKDPLPHFMAAMIRTDQFRPVEAVESARAARERLPYLKSLNPLANDQQGSANLGQAFAWLGLEDWARAYAQDSYSPFWAGSHLFLADRYNGPYTKNSELFQGFIGDPTVFGASQRRKPLVPGPAVNLNASLRYTRSDDLDGFSPQFETSGYRAENWPHAWYLGYENVDWEMAERPYTLDVFTAALGARPSHDTGMFLFADASRQDSEPLGAVNGLDYDVNDRLDTRRLDIGFGYAPRPTDRIWLKAGYFSSREDTAGTLGGEFFPIDAATDVELPEFGFRHSFELAGRHQLSWGMDYARRDTEARFDDIGLSLFNDYRLENHTLDVYLSDSYRLNETLIVQGDLYYQHHSNLADAQTYYGVRDPFFLLSEEGERQDHDRLSPRLGMVYRHNEQLSLRAAWQNWRRPAGMSTLGPVATAGIALDDRLVARGGELDRVRLQADWEATPRTFVTAYMDYKDIDNARFAIRPFSVGELESLAKLRPRDYGQLMRDDLYEFVDAPDYAGGTVRAAGLAVERIVGQSWGLMARYRHLDSRNSTDGSLAIPWLPRHTVALGATWIDPRGWYVAGRLIHRSGRYEDEANTLKRPAGLSGDLDVFRESADKRWLWRFSASDLFDDEQPEQFTIELNYRL